MASPGFPWLSLSLGQAIGSYRGGLILEERNQRTAGDRRKQPTPPLSQHTFLGRRKNLRRKSDREKGGYVDRYSSALFALLVLIVGLNILDALFTMIILDLKGWEANPIVRSVIQLHGEKFWIWKFALVSFCLVLLCLHSKFKLVRGMIIFLSSVYLIVVLYQLFLLIRP